MKLLLLSLCLIVTLSLFAACGTESGPVVENTGSEIQGVWTIEEMDTGIGDNKKTTVPQAFMMFINEKHYSAIRDFSSEPRQDMDSGSFMADAGTYDYDGSTLVVHHLVGMMPVMMNRGSSMTFGCEMEGDYLILTPQYDKMVLPGMDIAPSPDGKMSYGDMAVRYKFKRLE